MRGVDSAGFNVYVRGNDDMCLADSDRAVLQNGFGVGQGSRVSGESRRYDVQRASAPEGALCASCGDSEASCAGGGG